MIDFDSLKKPERSEASNGKTVLTLRIPVELRNEINDAAYKCRTSANKFCVAAIEDALRQLEEQRAEETINVRIAE